MDNKYGDPESETPIQIGVGMRFDQRAATLGLSNLAAGTLHVIVVVM